MNKKTSLLSEQTNLPDELIGLSVYIYSASGNEI
jgi:hypothetical protein